MSTSRSNLKLLNSQNLSPGHSPDNKRGDGRQNVKVLPVELLVKTLGEVWINKHWVNEGFEQIKLVLR